MVTSLDVAAQSKDEAGMIMGGGKWPRRLMMKCQDMYGNVGEEDVYKAWRETKKVRAFMEKLCIGLTKGEQCRS